MIIRNPQRVGLLVDLTRAGISRGRNHIKESIRTIYVCISQNICAINIWLHTSIRLQTSCARNQNMGKLHKLKYKVYKDDIEGMFFKWKGCLF